ncbi:SDR family oxidoreductase [Paenibacillus sp. FSL E2-0178]|uniref:SDR family NAD(P)-dependent oxidoreductase n=1 Tax=Paenibacillus sp. FSL E2-0178 TaxID=2921361 RepID=UPI003159836C
MGSLTDQVAVVTGAGTGLGRAAAIKLAEQGATVILVGRRQEKLQETASFIEESGGRAIVIPADVTIPEEVQHLRDQVIAQAGTADILINNAGGTGAPTHIHDLTFAAWDQTLQLNLYSPYLVTNAFLPIMREQQYGRIVSITSVMANLVYPGLGAYSAAKAGLEALMRTVAAEEAKHGIIVNLFDPGNLQTEQNPGGANDPATVVDAIIDLASLPAGSAGGEVIRALS